MTHPETQTPAGIDDEAPSPTEGEIVSQPEDMRASVTTEEYCAAFGAARSKLFASAEPTEKPRAIIIRAFPDDAGGLISQALTEFGTAGAVVLDPDELFVYHPRLGALADDSGRIALSKVKVFCEHLFDDLRAAAVEGRRNLIIVF